MATSKITLDNAIRAKYMELVKGCLEANGEQVLLVGSNEFALPCVDDEGNDKYLVLTFKVPTGARGGEPYNGFEEAEDYAAHLKAKKKKKKIAAEKKAKKIAADQALREEKARLKEIEKAKAE